MRCATLATLLAGLLTLGAYADPLPPAPTLTLIPASGTVAGIPGAVVGWGYDIDNSDDMNDWVVLNDSFVTGSLGSGTFGNYVDYVASQFIVIDPKSDTGPVPFVQGSAGLGEFDIADFVPVPTAITGGIDVDYAIFSQDPNSPNFDPGSFVTSGTLSVTAAVNVVPEPVSVLLLGTLLLPLGFVFSRRQRRS